MEGKKKPAPEKSVIRKKHSKTQRNSLNKKVNLRICQKIQKLFEKLSRFIKEARVQDPQSVCRQISHWRRKWIYLASVELGKKAGPSECKVPTYYILVILNCKFPPPLVE